MGQKIKCPYIVRCFLPDDQFGSFPEKTDSLIRTDRWVLIRPELSEKTFNRLRRI